MSHPNRIIYQRKSGLSIFDIDANINIHHFNLPHQVRTFNILDADNILYESSKRDLYTYHIPSLTPTLLDYYGDYVQVYDKKIAFADHNTCTLYDWNKHQMADQYDIKTGFTLVHIFPDKSYITSDINYKHHVFSSDDILKWSYLCDEIELLSDDEFILIDDPHLINIYNPDQKEPIITLDILEAVQWVDRKPADTYSGITKLPNNNIGVFFLAQFILFNKEGTVVRRLTLSDTFECVYQTVALHNTCIIIRTHAGIHQINLITRELTRLDIIDEKTNYNFELYPLSTIEIKDNYELLYPYIERCIIPDLIYIIAEYI